VLGVVPEPELDDGEQQDEQDGDAQDGLDRGVSVVARESPSRHQSVGMDWALAVTLATMIAPAAMASAAKMATMMTFSVISPRSLVVMPWTRSTANAAMTSRMSSSGMGWISLA